MNKHLTKSFLILLSTVFFVPPVLGGRLVAGRYEVRDLVPDPDFAQSGGAMTISDQKVQIGDLTLVSGLPYSVGVRAQGDGNLLISLEPKQAGSEAVSLTIPLDDSRLTYTHRTFTIKSSGHVAEFTLYLQSSAGKAIVDELHITPPANLLRNGGFEERMNAHQDVHLDEDLKKFFSAVAAFWSITGGDLQAVLCENAGYGASTGLSIEGGAGDIELTSSQIVLDSLLGPAMLGTWVNAPDGAHVEMSVRGHPLEVQKLTTEVSGLQFLSSPIESFPTTVNRISVSFRISKKTDKAVVLDDVQLMELTPPKPDLKVFVNQVGYEPGMPGRFVVATTFLDEDGVKYALRPAGGGTPLAEGTLECVGRVHEGRVDDWGAFYWPGEFPANIPDGEYVIEARTEEAQAVSETFQIGQSLLSKETSELAVDFFRYQRCGMEIPGFHKACHLDDARLPDGTHVEGWGGWHDAGDYNKYLGGGSYTGIAAFSLAYAVHDGPARFDKMDRNGDGVPDALDEAVWGGDFLRRMMDWEGGMHSSISTGYTFFGDPSLETDGWIGNDDDRPVHPGSSYQHFAVATWAILAMEIPDRREEYLASARKHWDYALTHRGAGEQFLIDALYFYEATGDEKVYGEVTRLVSNLLKGQIKEGPWRGGFGDPKAPATDLVNMGVRPAALALFALKHPDDPLSVQVRDFLKNYLRFCEAISDNPFGITRLMHGEEPNYLFPRGGWAVGNDSQYLSQAWAACLANRVVPDERWLAYAERQLDWVLGLNPLNVCLMEAAGSINLPTYHHRYVMIPNNPRGAVPGAVVNGIVGTDPYHDSPHVDMDPFPLAEYECNEPWLPHNAFFVLAICEWGTSRCEKH